MIQILIFVLLFDIMGPMIDPTSPIKDPFNPYNNWNDQRNQNYEPNIPPPRNNTSQCDVWCHIASLFK